MTDEHGKGRVLFHTLNSSLTKNSQFIIMNREGYRDFCEWAKLWAGKESYPDSFANIPIVLDLRGSSYVKIVGYASEEYNNTNQHHS